MTSRLISTWKKETGSDTEEQESELPIHIVMPGKFTGQADELKKPLRPVPLQWPLVMPTLGNDEQKHLKEPVVATNGKRSASQAGLSSPNLRSTHIAMLTPTDGVICPKCGELVSSDVEDDSTEEEEDLYDFDEELSEYTSDED